MPNGRERSVENNNMKTQRTHNQPDQKELRRKLRAKSTPEEDALWQLLRAKRLEGTRWCRQYSVGAYVLDFYCPAAKLCVEVDGIHHLMEEEIARDTKRTAYLGSKGIAVLRIPNEVVLKQSDIAMTAIIQELTKREQDRPHPPSAPSPNLGEGK